MYKILKKISDFANSQIGKLGRRKTLVFSIAFLILFAFSARTLALTYVAIGTINPSSTCLPGDCTVRVIPDQTGSTGLFLTTDGTTTSWAAAGSGITTLNALTGASQTFVDDTNVTLVSTGTTHTITWAGQLAVSRGGTGLSSTGTANQILGMNSGGTALEPKSFAVL